MYRLYKQMQWDDINLGLIVWQNVIMKIFTYSCFLMQPVEILKTGLSHVEYNSWVCSDIHNVTM